VAPWSRAHWGRTDAARRRRLAVELVDPTTSRDRACRSSPSGRRRRIRRHHVHGDVGASTMAASPWPMPGLDDDDVEAAARHAAMTRQGGGLRRGAARARERKKIGRRRWRSWADPVAEQRAAARRRVGSMARTAMRSCPPGSSRNPAHQFVGERRLCPEPPVAGGCRATGAGLRGRCGLELGEESPGTAAARGRLMKRAKRELSAAKQARRCVGSAASEVGSLSGENEGPCARAELLAAGGREDAAPRRAGGAPRPSATIHPAPPP